jgi:hypothetical protein
MAGISSAEEISGLLEIGKNDGIHRVSTLDPVDDVPI